MFAMEHYHVAALRSNYMQMLPRRRKGQIKFKIPKGFVKSEMSFASLATSGFGHKIAEEEEEDGGPFSSPPSTPSGCNSDACEDHMLSLSLQDRVNIFDFFFSFFLIFEIK